MDRNTVNFEKKSIESRARLEHPWYGAYNLFE
jgi:hypothetical protein